MLKDYPLALEIKINQRGNENKNKQIMHRDNAILFNFLYSVLGYQDLMNLTNNLYHEEI